MSNDYEMLEEAIAALSNAMQAMQLRLRDMQTRLDDIERQRMYYLRKEVERLLPAFTKRALALLENEVPAFVTTVVRNAFIQNRKVIGIFKPSGYGSALSMTKARLASYIEQTRRNDFSRFDREITTLDKQISKLDFRFHETTLNLKAMTVALHRKGTITPEARSQIASIVGRFRQSNSGSHTGTARFNSYTHSGKRTIDQRTVNTESAASSDDDLWIYQLTDIPTSFRTWMLGSISQRHSTTFSECNYGHYGESTNADSSASTSVNYDLASAIGAMAVNAGLNAIATDDRLGAFS